MNVAGIQPFPFTIPADGRAPVSIPCEFVHCIASTGNFYVSRDGGGEIFFGTNKQTRFNSVAERGFELVNKTALPITGTLLVGFGEYFDNDVTIGGAVKTQGGASSVSAVKTITNVPTLIMATNINRTGWTVRNNDTGKIIYIGGAGVTTADGWPVWPGEPYGEDSTDAIYGIVDAGTAELRVREVTV